QNPHCRPPEAAKASAKLDRSSPEMPSNVVIDLPATLATDWVQATIGLPSTSTVQQPHCPDGEQPSLGEVTSSSSRSAASRCGWSARTDTGWPFTVNATACVPVE